VGGLRWAGMRDGREHMDNKEETQNAAGKPKTNWEKIILIVLICEKIIQHVVVSLAFYFNWKSIISAVKVDSTILMVLGAIVAVLFMVSLWGIITQKRWAINLVILLALFDIIGEFAAHVRIDIVITVSFLVAILLLILALSSRQKN
jgi:hypothetical protein